MKTFLLILWLTTGSHTVMATRAVANEAQCETAGQAWEKKTDQFVKHRFACLPLHAGN